MGREKRWTKGKNGGLEGEREEGKGESERGQEKDSVQTSDDNDAFDIEPLPLRSKGSKKISLLNCQATPCINSVLRLSPSVGLGKLCPFCVSPFTVATF